MFPKIAIVVLNWNDWPDTVECFESLEKLDYANFEVIFVDNASTTNPSVFEERKEHFRRNIPGFLFIQTGSNLGYAGGNNVGIKTALTRGAEWVLILNHDTVVTPGFLSELVEAVREGLVKTSGAFGNERGAGIVGPRILQPDGRLWALGGRFSWNLLSVTRGLPDTQERSGVLITADYVSGTAMIVARSVFETIGFLPETYFLYYEDFEFCLQARRAGFFVGIAPRAIITHKVSQSAQAGSPSYTYYHFRNSLLFTQRNLSMPLRLVVYVMSAWWALKQIVKLCIPSRRQNGLAGLYGMRDFWLGRSGQWMGFAKR